MTINELDAQPAVLNDENIKLKKHEMIEAAVSDIAKCEFVAIDLEFTGLFNTPEKATDLNGFYELTVKSVEKFMTVQLGICPVWRSSSDSDYKKKTQSDGNDNYWFLAPYNFYVYPLHRRIYSFDTNTLSWLHSNGFNFEAWLKNGIDYERLSSLQSPTAFRKEYIEAISQKGLQRVLDSIIIHQKPIVVHNGFFDLLHIHDKFIASIPPTVSEFCHDCLNIFVGGIFDTKFIAGNRNGFIFGIADDRGTALDTLFSHLNSKDHQSIFKIVSRQGSNSKKLTMNYTLHGTSDGDKCHEAGYDALTTAKVFLLENEIMHQNTQSKDLNCKIPLDWATSEHFGSKYRNVLELKVPPGYLQFQDQASLFVNPVPEDISPKIVTAVIPNKNVENNISTAIAKNLKRIKPFPSINLSVIKKSFHEVKHKSVECKPYRPYPSYHHRRIYPNLKLENKPNATWATPLRGLVPKIVNTLDET